MQKGKGVREKLAQRTWAPSLLSKGTASLNVSCEAVPGINMTQPLASRISQSRVLRDLCAPSLKP